MRKSEIIIIMLTAALIIAVFTHGIAIRWKTEACVGGGYVTHFYSNGKYNCSVKTTKKVKVYISENPKNIVFRKNHYILVEKVKGECNEKGDGKDRRGNYISYRNVKNFRKGKYTTYLIYGNDNSTDNVIGRIDCRS